MGATQFFARIHETVGGAVHGIKETQVAQGEQIVQLQQQGEKQGRQLGNVAKDVTRLKSDQVQDRITIAKCQSAISDIRRVVGRQLVPLREKNDALEKQNAALQAKLRASQQKVRQFEERDLSSRSTLFDDERPRPRTAIKPRPRPQTAIKPPRAAIVLPPFDEVLAAAPHPLSISKTPAKTAKASAATTSKKRKVAETVAARHDRAVEQHRKRAEDAARKKK